MQKKEIITTVYEIESINELLPEEQALVAKAKEAAQSAYAPYSKFKVGAAVLLNNNEIVIGSNQENAAYPSGLCAERVAIFHANALYPNVAVKTIAITAIVNNRPAVAAVPPCGACRQVLLETEHRYKQKVKVIMVGEKKSMLVDDIQQLLPLNFDKNWLSL